MFGKIVRRIVEFVVLGQSRFGHHWESYTAHGEQCAVSFWGRLHFTRYYCNVVAADSASVRFGLLGYTLSYSTAWGEDAEFFGSGWSFNLSMFADRLSDRIRDYIIARVRPYAYRWGVLWPVVNRLRGWSDDDLPF